MASFLRNNASRLAGIAIVVVLYWLARLPAVSTAERAELAGRFRLTELPLAEVPGESRIVRPVHPSYEHISGWISSVGGSVALNDLDGDGLANDVCYVDTRIDRVVVAPAPGSGERFAPFCFNDASVFDRRTMCPTGCLPGDFNEDGLTDVLVYYWGRPPVVFLRKADSQHPAADAFALVDLVPDGGRWFSNAATQADLDGDGHVDLIIGNYFPDGSHTLDVADVTPENMHDSMSRAFNGGGKHVLLWAGGTAGSAPAVRFKHFDNVFDDVLNHSWTLAIGAADLDGDQLPELYFSHDFGPDRLLHNRSTPGYPRFSQVEGERTFTMPKSKVLGQDSFKGMSCEIADLDGDGLLDIYVSNIAGEYALEESHFAFINTGRLDDWRQGVAPFVDRSEELGLSRSNWGWDTRLVDLDNDGVPEALQATGFMRGTTNRWPELHEVGMGNDQLLHVAGCWHCFRPGDELSGRGHNPIFARAGDGRYYDLAEELGLGATRISRGIASADVDGDGDLDYAMGNQWEASYLYRNDCPAPGKFLALRLLVPCDAADEAPTQIQAGHQAVRSARPAIGAQARLRRADGKQMVGLVDGGNGHSGKRSADVHFGLAKVDDAPLPVEVRWRTARGEARQTTLQLTPGWHTVVLSNGLHSAAAQQQASR